MYDISFPNIGIYLRNIPTGITIFGFEIRFYGIVILLGFWLAYLLAVKEAKRTEQDPELYLDYLLAVIIPGILCARIYYILFQWDSFFLPGATAWETFLRCINIRQGGLAIYGGLIGGVLVCILLARARKVSFFTMLDTIIIGVPLAQMLGRWGNFFNREAFGGYTDSLFAMAIPLEFYEGNGILSYLRSTNVITDEMMANVVDGCIWVHPTFLYEGIWNLAIFIFLMLWRKHKRFSGEFIAIYMGAYGLGRFWIEALRTDSLMIGNSGLRVSQILGLSLVVISVAGYLVGYIQYKNRLLEASGESPSEESESGEFESGESESEESPSEELPSTESKVEEDADGESENKESEREESESIETKAEEPQSEESKSKETPNVKSKKRKKRKVGNPSK